MRINACTPQHRERKVLLKWRKREKKIIRFLLCEISGLPLCVAAFATSAVALYIFVRMLSSVGNWDER